MTAPIPDPPPESGLTREDVLRAQEAWKRFSPPAWKSLLDSPATEPEKGKRE